jgi:hypothetical protein
VPTTEAPAAIPMRRVLKRFWRSWGIGAVALGPDATTTVVVDESADEQPDARNAKFGAQHGKDVEH